MHLCGQLRVELAQASSLAGGQQVPVKSTNALRQLSRAEQGRGRRMGAGKTQWDRLPAWERHRAPPAAGEAGTPGLLQRGLEALESRVPARLQLPLPALDLLSAATLADSSGVGRSPLPYQLSPEGQPSPHSQNWDAGIQSALRLCSSEGGRLQPSLAGLLSTQMPPGAREEKGPSTVRSEQCDVPPRRKDTPLCSKWSSRNPLAARTGVWSLRAWSLRLAGVRVGRAWSRTFRAEASAALPRARGNGCFWRAHPVGPGTSQSCMQPTWVGSGAELRASLPGSVFR